MQGTLLDAWGHSLESSFLPPVSGQRSPATLWIPSLPPGKTKNPLWGYALLPRPTHLSVCDCLSLSPEKILPKQILPYSMLSSWNSTHVACDQDKFVE